MIEGHRPLVDDLVSGGQELVDVYSVDEAQRVRSDVELVTSTYDDVKRTARDKVHTLSDALRATLNDVSLHSAMIS